MSSDISQNFGILPIVNAVGESALSPKRTSGRELIVALRSLPRKILLAEDEQSVDHAYIDAQCLQPGDVGFIISSIQQVVSAPRNRSTP